MWCGLCGVVAASKKLVIVVGLIELLGGVCGGCGGWERNAPLLHLRIDDIIIFAFFALLRAALVLHSLGERLGFLAKVLNLRF